MTIDNNNGGDDGKGYVLNFNDKHNTELQSNPIDTRQMNDEDEKIITVIQKQIGMYSIVCIFHAVKFTKKKNFIYLSMHFQ